MVKSVAGMGLFGVITASALGYPHGYKAVSNQEVSINLSLSAKKARKTLAL